MNDTAESPESLDHAPRTARPLVIGYGNPLRGDDAVGWRAALTLARDHRLAGVDVLARHQLVPELAVDIAAASRVVFIDARDVAATFGGDDGTIRTAALRAEAASLTWTHHLGPASLLGLAEELYEASPPATLVTAPATCLEVSEHLSPEGERLLEVIVELVAGLLTEGAAHA